MKLTYSSDDPRRMDEAIGWPWRKVLHLREWKYTIAPANVIQQVWGKQNNLCLFTDNSTYRWSWHTRRMIADEWMKPSGDRDKHYYICGIAPANVILRFLSNDNSTFWWSLHTRRMIAHEWIKPSGYPDEKYYICALEPGQLHVYM